ncbi:hypothetical protein FGB62_22g93 [Gracilaria domingensis]|nr:hypothetical protein FGB62_22g93 [Gracilaria domingensis]
MIGVIDNDVGEGGIDALVDLHETRINSIARQFVHNRAAVHVVAHLGQQHALHAQPPRRRHGVGQVAAAKQRQAPRADLGVGRGEALDLRQQVGGRQPEPQHARGAQTVGHAHGHGRAVAAVGGGHLRARARAWARARRRAARDGERKRGDERGGDGARAHDGRSARMRGTRAAACSSAGSCHMPRVRRLKGYPSYPWYHEYRPSVCAQTHRVRGRGCVVTHARCTVAPSLFSAARHPAADGAVMRALQRRPSCRRAVVDLRPAAGARRAARRHAHHHARRHVRAARAAAADAPRAPPPRVCVRAPRAARRRSGAGAGAGAGAVALRGAAPAGAARARHGAPHRPRGPVRGAAGARGAAGRAHRPRRRVARAARAPAADVGAAAQAGRARARRRVRAVCGRALRAHRRAERAHQPRGVAPAGGARRAARAAAGGLRHAPRQGRRPGGGHGRQDGRRGRAPRARAGRVHGPGLHGHRGGALRRRVAGDHHRAGPHGAGDRAPQPVVRAAVHAAAHPHHLRRRHRGAAHDAR